MMEELKKACTEHILFDLQYFADEEKTEEATPRKRQEARKRGQVPRSPELSTIITLLIGFLALNGFGGIFIRRFYNYFLTGFTPENLNQQLSDVTVANIFLNHLSFILTSFLPIGLTVMAVGLMVNILQTGWVFSVETLKMQWDKLNPLKGFQRLFSIRSLVELGKALFKLGAVIGIVFSTYRRHALPLAETSLFIPSLEAAVRIWQIITGMVIQICLVLLVLAVLDYFYQRYDYNKSLKMTKKEVRDEHRQTEGDPLIKSRIRQKQRQMAMRRMMQQVPKADVVITNPTHLAVAIMYDAKKMTAPQVVAKGEGLIAEKIKELAKEYKVPIVENKPLARTIYQTVEIGEFIPPNLYQAVAEVLAFVYKLRRRVQ